MKILFEQNQKSYFIFFIFNAFHAMERKFLASKILEFKGFLNSYYPFSILKECDFLGVYWSTQEEPIYQIDDGLGSIDHFLVRNIVKKLFEEQSKQNKRVLSYNSLFVFLIPQNLSSPSCFDFENFDDDFFVVGTNFQHYWQQVIIRGLSKVMGISDEFVSSEEKPKESQFSITKGGIKDFFSPNLIFSPFNDDSIDLNKTSWSRFKDHGSDNVKLSKKFKYHKNDYSDSPISLLEVGGDFIPGIFSTNQNCLMKKKPGSRISAIGQKKVPLCNICAEYILEMLITNKGFRRGNTISDSLHFDL